MAYLVLEDGSLFEGELFGSEKDACGEVIFNTAACGYEDIISDPSYGGQIVVMTYPLFGNYGMNMEDVQSEKPQISGVIVREVCDFPSNFKCKETVQAYMKRNNIAGICGVDTRAITRKIRDNGIMKGAICLNKPNDAFIKNLKNEDKNNYVVAATCNEKYNIKGNGANIAILDLGLKKCTLNAFSKRDCNITVFPANSKAQDILAINPDAVVVSSGAGNPANQTEIIQTVKELNGKKPILGIGLGNLILALANGLTIEKLKFGHHGGNQPIKELATNKVYISGQNHEYVINPKSVKSQIGEVIYKNANDDSIEGVKYNNTKSVGVQFNPEACSGPRNTIIVYDEFLKSLKG